LRGPSTGWWVRSNSGPARRVWKRKSTGTPRVADRRSDAGTPAAFLPAPGLFLIHERGWQDPGPERRHRRGAAHHARRGRENPHAEVLVRVVTFFTGARCSQLARGPCRPHPVDRDGGAP